MTDKVKEWVCKVDKNPHIYSFYSDDPTSSKSFAKFKADNSEHLKLLYCIDALNEGIHIDDISGVILLRPTVSPIIYKQQIGRALSAGKSRNPIIFDIVNNIENLYSIDSVEEEMRTAIQYYRSHGREKFIINDSFELIDKVVDCKALFNKLEKMLSASWDLMYESARKYYEEFGNLDIPKNYFTPEGYSLGRWLITQRRVYNGRVNGILTQIQINKLNDIGMRWESKAEQSWEKYFSSAKRYYEKNGDLNPLALYVDEDGINLGRWISDIRTQRKSEIKRTSLTQEKIARLDEIGMIWDVPDYIWEEYFASAVRYHREHGDLNVPHNYIDEEGIKLGQWISNIKNTRKGNVKNCRKLTDEQIARLDALGMIWETKYEKQWNDAFQALCDYYKKNGTFEIPVAYQTNSGIRLGVWVRRQRNFYAKGSLSDEQIARLREIGFTLEKSDPWEEKYQLAKKYYEEHGNLNMSSQYVVNGVWLHKWLNEQKLIAEGRRKKQHTPEQLAKLEAIGLRFGTTFYEELWNTRYEIAKKYFEEHGDLNVPKDYCIGDFELGIWIKNQKAQRKAGIMSDNHIERLTVIGMEWDNVRQQNIEKSYEIGFRHLEKFIAEYGIDFLTGKSICEDGYKLGKWIANCKIKYRSGKLAKKHIAHFEKLGISLEKNKNSWDMHFQELCDYIQKHGTLQIPKNYISESGIKLNIWLNDQKRKCRQGTLKSKQLEKLQSIGVKI